MTKQDAFTITSSLSRVSQVVTQSISEVVTKSVSSGSDSTSKSAECAQDLSINLAGIFGNFIAESFHGNPPTEADLEGAVKNSFRCHHVKLNDDEMKKVIQSIADIGLVSIIGIAETISMVNATKVEKFNDEQLQKLSEVLAEALGQSVVKSFSAEIGDVGVQDFAPAFNINGVVVSSDQVEQITSDLRNLTDFVRNKFNNTYTDDLLEISGDVIAEAVTKSLAGEKFDLNEVLSRQFSQRDNDYNLVVTGANRNNMIDLLSKVIDDVDKTFVQSATKNGENKLSDDEIAGIAFGVTAFVVCVGVTAGYCAMKRKRAAVHNGFDVENGDGRPNSSTSSEEFTNLAQAPHQGGVELQ